MKSIMLPNQWKHKWYTVAPKASEILAELKLFRILQKKPRVLPVISQVQVGFWDKDSLQVISTFHFPLLLFELYTSITTHVCFHPDFARHLLWARRLISLLVTSAVRTDYREKAITETWGWIRSEACRQKRPFTAAAAAARPAVVSNIMWNCCWTQADGRQGKMYVL